MSKQKHFYAISHRGKEFSDFGYHSRVPLALKDLSINALLVLAFIDIDQFQDQKFRRGGKRRSIEIKTFINGLGISEKSVRRAIKELKTKRAISIRREVGGVTYTSNILKLNSRYQIITLAFIIRLDISTLSKGLILRVIMDNTERVQNLGTVSDVARMVNMSRDSVYKVFRELSDAGYMEEMEDTNNFAIDMERLMLESNDTIHREVIDLRARNAYLIQEIEKVNPAWRKD